MTIKEVEERTQLSRSNIRFYEKEKLIEPSRNDRNGYRDYSESDVEAIKKIAYLRTLGISIEDIRNVILEKCTLREIVMKQNLQLEKELNDLHKAKAMCQRILDEGILTYQDLQIDTYVDCLEDYWKDNEKVFKVDCVSFMYIWGSFIIWGIITVVCLAAAVLFYAKLPPLIPVQWSHGTSSNFADKRFIFAYPAACVAVRYLLRPFIFMKLRMQVYNTEAVTDYLSNYFCFILLSVQIFTILYVYDVVHNIVVVFAVDSIVLLGLLFAALRRKAIAK